MIIYNRTWIKNLEIIQLVERENREGFIPERELKSIKQHFPVGFYSPNLFIRVGLFLLTCVISTFSCGFISLLFGGSGFIESYGWIVFLGTINYIALEVIVNTKFHFRSGVDDALLWISAGLFTIAFVWATERLYKDQYLIVATFVFFLSVILTLRFKDRLMSLILFLSAAAIVFFAWQKTGSFALFTMPFILMLFSGITYLLLKRVETRKAAVFYCHSIFIVKIAALVLLYLSGNYYIVKELGDILNGTVSQGVPFGWIFWLWTMLLPLVYFAFGIRIKKRQLLHLGFLLSICSIITFRSYYHLMPIEYACILGGLAALAISYFVTKYLKTPKHRFTSTESDNHSLAEKLNLESLIISETLSGTSRPTVQENSRFGGGKFGGGGAESNF